MEAGKKTKKAAALRSVVCHVSPSSGTLRLWGCERGCVLTAVAKQTDSCLNPLNQGWAVP